MTPTRRGYTLISGGGSSGSDATKVDRYTTQSKTASFTAAPGFVYLVDSTAGAVVATLPAANVAGQSLIIKWDTGANAVTVQRAGSDTIGAAATSATLQLANEVWEFTSSGSGQWNLTGGNKTLSSLDARYPLASLLTTGEETIIRDLVTANGLSTTSQALRLTYLTARKSETTTQVRFPSGAAGAGATPTLCRIGLYLIAANGDGTLVASTTNDTALWSAPSTIYTRSWTAPYAKIAGQQYALGLLVVTAAATPTFPGNALAAGVINDTAQPPRLSAVLAGQTDLPGSFTAASLTTTGQRFYGVILP